MSKYKFNRSFAIIIGINNYENGIPELETAVPDALKLAQIIQEQHQNLKQQYQAQNKYEVQLLLNQRVTLKKLNQLIEDFKKGQIFLDKEKVTVNNDDRVLFYFAGHGIALEALENQEGPVGYLIPQDATLGDSTTYLPMQELHDALNALPCRQMLAILDCCFAGAFRWASLKREIVPKVTVYKERYDRFICDAAWQVITSAADDQKALDSLGQRGKVIDGNEVHSPFAKALFDALRGGTDEGADSNKDGIITATELYLYLRDRVEILTENHYKRQTPGLCPLKKHDKGEFIFLLPNFDRDKLEDAPPLNLENNPYKGLQSYNEKDSDLFFGREKQIEKLYQKVVDNKQRLTLVLGASGTGKSSLVKAGLIPKLRKDDKTWSILPTFRPGESPFKSLNNVLKKWVKQPLIPTSPEPISSDLLTLSEESLANWFNNNPEAKLMVVIDQFEELITLCKSEEREQFQKLIKNSLATYSDKIHVVISLRLDFEAQFQTSVLKDFWNSDTRFVVPPMTQDDLREVIEKPASQKVLYFDPPSLVDELINEVVQMPGALPLLSFTLSELYLKHLGDRTRDNRALTKKDYEELGRVFGSITKRANEEYERLVRENPAYEKTVRWVMLRMISLQGGELARRQVLKSELVYPSQEQSDRVQTVIERFSQARLIVAGSNPQGETYVEPAHDALVQGWDKILRWKDEDALDLVLQRSLDAQVSSWNNNGKPLARLWHDDDRLPLLKQLLEDEAKNWLNEQETDFVEQSIKQKRKQEDELTQNRINELTPLANSRFRDHEQLEALTYILRAGKLLQKLIRENSPHLSQETRLNTQLVLQQILSKVEEKNRFMLQSRIAHAIDFSRDGQIIATVDDESGIVKLFDPEGKQINPRQMNGDMLMEIFDVPEGEIITLRGGSKYLYLLNPDGTLRLLNLYLSPDGGIFAQRGQRGEARVKLYSSRDGAELNTLTGFHEDTFMTVAFSPDSQVIASGGWYGFLYLWNRDGELITQQNAGGGSLNTIDFSPNGEMLATGSNDGKVRLWNLDGTPMKEFQAHRDTIWGLCFSPNGEMFATGSNDRSVKLWQPNGIQVKTLEGHKGIVRAVAFNPNDSQNLASSSDDGSVKIWNLGGTGLKILDRHEDSVNKVRFSPDGKTILTTSGHGKVSFWRTDGTLFKQESWHNGPISTLDFSPNGEKIVTASGDKEVILRNSDSDFIANIKQWDGSEWDGIEVLGASFSPNNQVIALADQQGSVKLYNLGDGTFTTLRDGSGDPSHVWAVKFSPNGNILASAHHEGVVALWQDGTLLNTLPRDQNYTTFTKTDGVYYNSVLGIDFSPNGDLIASAHIDGTVKLWKLDGSSDEPLILGEPSSNILVRSLRFSPKGDLIASAYTDGTVKLWNLNGSLHKILEGHKSGVTAVDFSPNGKTLASASEDKTVILWDLERSQDLDGLLQRGCEWAEGYLTNNPNITNEDRQIILNINKNP
ncbi:nSTAND1 domain-containing NTPase [Mastigocladopsis repens]|uniref:nSTAND1 domain-containing NTPase n=1 Tax=Mastigocladopsis repens TaxID=221287 RepID=UPI0003002259|nr:caspase family protein [Mastigocladopsis repens]